VDAPGDLVARNGMTVNRASGSYLTDAYPLLLGCLQGKPDPSAGQSGRIPDGSSGLIHADR